MPLKWVHKSSYVGWSRKMPPERVRGVIMHSARRPAAKIKCTGFLIFLFGHQVVKPIQTYPFIFVTVIIISVVSYTPSVSDNVHSEEHLAVVFIYWLVAFI